MACDESCISQLRDDALTLTAPDEKPGVGIKIFFAVPILSFATVKMLEHKFLINRET